MQVDDLIIVSVDDHVIEPEDMFKAHVPAKWADQAPHIERTAEGTQQWIFEGGPLSTTTAINAVVSWPKEEWGFNPATYSEMRPGTYDVVERVRDMDRNGVLASMCFPTFPGFSGRGFQDAKDKDLALTMLKAYNDWHIDEFAASHPGRFMPLALPPVWDIDALVAETRRVRAKGCNAITMPELPFVQGLPSYHSDYWFPFFQACVEEEVVVCLHIGQGFAALTSSPGAPMDNLMILATQVSVLAAQDLLWGPVLRTFPALKVAWSEGGIGWLPFYLDRCDRHYVNQKWTRQDFGGKLPSEVLKEHSLFCYITDPSTLRLRDVIGVENIALESDYPHSDCLWPDAPEVFLKELTDAGASDAEVDMITWQNAAAFFDWDPFQHISRSDATVGALRSKALDVETDIVPRAEWRRRYDAAHA